MSGKLTPLDVVQQTFRAGLRGYDRDEVHGFLRQVSDVMEEMAREVMSLRDELRHSRAATAEHVAREAALREALVTAQKVREDIERTAQQEARAKVAEAELQAEKILALAHGRRIELVGELRELRAQRAQFEAELRGLLGTHAAVLDARHDAEQAREDDAALEKLRVLRPREPESAEDTLGGGRATAEK